MIEFQPWPKTPRLMRDITITEKLDGTNAAVGIVPVDSGGVTGSEDPSIIAHLDTERGPVGVYAQSRTRLIAPEQDNYGFAGWVYRNAQELVEILGEGLHFGEWWGNGIQRKYGLNEKRFSLFNADRYKRLETGLVNVVPVLYQGPNDTSAIAAALEQLRMNGSVAAPGFMNPEGICVYSHASRTVSKVTLDHNDAGKWEAP